MALQFLIQLFIKQLFSKMQFLMYSETSLQFRKDRGRGAGCDIRLRKQQDMDINTFFFSFFTILIYLLLILYCIV